MGVGSTVVGLTQCDEQELEACVQELRALYEAQSNPQTATAGNGPLRAEKKNSRLPNTTQYLFWHVLEHVLMAIKYLHKVSACALVVCNSLSRIYAIDSLLRMHAFNRCTSCINSLAASLQLNEAFRRLTISCSMAVDGRPTLVDFYRKRRC